MNTSLIVQRYLFASNIKVSQFDKFDISLILSTFHIDAVFVLKYIALVNYERSNPASNPHYDIIHSFLIYTLLSTLYKVFNDKYNTAKDKFNDLSKLNAKHYFRIANGHVFINNRIPKHNTESLFNEQRPQYGVFPFTTFKMYIFLYERQRANILRCPACQTHIIVSLPLKMKNILPIIEENIPSIR